MTLPQDPQLTKQVQRLSPHKGIVSAPRRFQHEICLIEKGCRRHLRCIQHSEFGCGRSCKPSGQANKLGNRVAMVWHCEI